MEISPVMLDRVAARFGALADVSRLRLLIRLKAGPASVSELVAECGVSQASASKHLGLLHDVGLLVRTREGNRVIYEASDPGVFDLCDIVCQGVANHARQTHESISGARA